MILCDPFAINTVSKSVIKQLQRLVNTELLPRVSFLSGFSQCQKFYHSDSPFKK